MRLRKDGLILFGAVFLFCIFVFFQSVNATTYSCNSCGTCSAFLSNATSVAGDIIQLSTSLSGISSLGCINFTGKDNVIFDCNGNTIDGTDVDSSRGINVSNNANNNTVRNCIVTDFYYGITVLNSTNNTFSNINATSNPSMGFSIDFLNHSVFSNVNSSFSGYGFYMSQSNNNSFSNVTAQNDSSSGIFLDGGNNNTFTNISLSNNGGLCGMTLDNSYNNVLRNITVTSNTCGILLTFSGNNTLINNNMSGNIGNNFGMHENFSNTIELSNIVDYIHKIYYNSSLFNYVYNPTTAPNAGAIYCISCANITLRDINTTHYNRHGIFFSNATNLTIYNVSSGFNDYGILLESTSNSNVSNATLNSNSEGISVVISSNNTFSNINSISNGYGISTFLSSNNTFSNINSSFNSGYGFQISSSTTNSRFSNIISNNNLVGITLSSSSNNTFSNITSNSNSQNGFSLSSSSDNNTFSNITANNNLKGISISTFNNTFRNSYIKNNSQYGLYINDLDFVSPSNNTFYNNIFNNTVNYYNESFFSLNISNYFNTTLSLGTSIVGGINLGGNYWAFPNGSGFSETCTDSDSNQICDSSYTLDAFNFDYYPLNIIPIPATSSTTSSESSGGGTAKSSSVATNAGVPTSIPINSPADTEITGITITTNSDASKVSISVSEIDVSSADIEISSNGLVYKAFQIIPEGINDSQIENASISFKVDKNWVQENNMDTSTIKLYRKNGEWASLPTTFVSQDADYFYYNGISKGFSDYAIVAEKKQEIIQRINENLQNKIFLLAVLPLLVVVIILLAWSYILYKFLDD